MMMSVVIITKILKNLKVPTGNILIVQGELGKLEMLSLGDYGKEVNVKCDAMGLTREVPEVKHTKMLPLEDKWVITISTQYGCYEMCLFCDVPKATRFSRNYFYQNKALRPKFLNATFNDLIKQVLIGLKLHPEVEFSKRLNIHFARMGEPTWNPNVLDATKWLKEHIDSEYHIHPVVSTMMPKRNIWLKTFIHTWMRMKNRLLKGEAGLQLSINSTDENERHHMFCGSALTLKEISKIMDGIVPSGRKITLNFAVAGYKISGETLREYFDPDDYICKLTPMHKTVSAVNSKMCPEKFDYREAEKDLKKAGFDVIVFQASKEEDFGRITCGNAILSGTLPEVPYKVV